jgi:hypothetical protein
MIVKEVHAKTILSNSKVFDYVVNPYVGCGHVCLQARFLNLFRFGTYTQQIQPTDISVVCVFVSPFFVCFRVFRILGLGIKFYRGGIQFWLFFKFAKLTLLIVENYREGIKF